MTSEAETLLEQSLEYCQQDLYEEALPLLNEALRREPQFVRAYVARGHCHAGVGEIQRAFDDFQRAIELAPEDMSCRLARAEKYWRRGYLYIDACDYQRALADIEYALRSEPENAEACYHRAQTMLRLKRMPEAYRDIERAILLEPASSRYHSMRGNMLYWDERYQEAIPDFSIAIKSDPEQFQQDICYRCHAYLEIASWHNAIADAEQVLKRLSTKWYIPTFAYRDMGRAYLGLEDYRKAIKYLKLARDPRVSQKTNREIHEHLAQAYSGLGKTTRAKRELALAREIESDFPTKKERTSAEWEDLFRDGETEYLLAALESRLIKKETALGSSSLNDVQKTLRLTMMGLCAVEWDDAYYMCERRIDAAACATAYDAINLPVAAEYLRKYCVEQVPDHTKFDEFSSEERQGLRSKIASRRIAEFARANQKAACEW